MTARRPEKLRAPPARSRWQGERTRLIPATPARRGPPRRPPRVIAEQLRERLWHTR